MVTDSGMKRLAFRSTKLSAPLELNTKHKASFNHLAANFL